MISCDPSTLANAARCFDNCIPKGMQAAVTTYLLWVIAGSNIDFTHLADEANCFTCLFGSEEAVKTYLLCQIAQ